MESRRGTAANALDLRSADPDQATCPGLHIQGPEDLVFEPVVFAKDGNLFALDCSRHLPGGSLKPLILEVDMDGSPACCHLMAELFRLIRDFPGSPAAILGVSEGAFGEDSSTLTLIDEAAGMAHLDPGKVVLELTPDRPNFDLIRFETVEEVRALGFQVAIANSFLSDSGMQTLLETRPDYIRVGAGVVSGCASDFFRQAILETVSQLAFKFGALVIAAGVDDPRDRDTVLEGGVSLMKGVLAGSPIGWNALVHAAGEQIRPLNHHTHDSGHLFEDRSGRKHG